MTPVKIERYLNASNRPCLTCAAAPGSPHQPTQEGIDSYKDTDLEEFFSEPTATDGCTNVELDACCEHGHPPWLLHLGMI